MKTHQGPPCKRGHSGERYDSNNSCVSCVAEKWARKHALRGGRVKCRRCREIFIRVSGESHRICERCRAHCARCDISLNEENWGHTGKNRNQYFCKSCVAEVVRNTTSKEHRRDYQLLRHYGITVNEYNTILAAQGGVCWICKRQPKNVALSVDHKHEAGENRRNPRAKRKRVRGLLCWHCNNAIAKFDDNAENLRRAAEYLDKCPAQAIIGEV